MFSTSLTCSNDFHNSGVSASKLPFLISVSYAACRNNLSKESPTLLVAGWLVSPHELRREGYVCCFFFKHCTGLLQGKVL